MENNALNTMCENAKNPDGESLIQLYFTNEMLKMLHYHAMRVDIEDNNEKAELIKELLGPEFIELGTGTNRIALLHNNFVYKIALDYRGYVDNFTELKRSSELPMYLAKVYESNMLINVCEYVNVMDPKQFKMNEDAIKCILADLSKSYVFDDIGFTLKNSYNWGYRDSNALGGTESGEDEIVILDYGYLYSSIGQEGIFSCPKCKGRLRYNSTYTRFKCDNSSCRTEYRVQEILRRMRPDFQEIENKVISELNNLTMPEFEDITAL